MGAPSLAKSSSVVISETALMRVQHDIANAMGTNQAALLVLLDMSAAFDTIDANILIDTLHNRLGVKGTPLKWFRSYLSDRCFAVKVGNSQSADHKLKYGVPQGSVLGPFLIHGLLCGYRGDSEETWHQIP